MRLLKWHEDNGFKLVRWPDDSAPRYAILSHTWGLEDEEVTFADIEANRGRTKPGYEKIKYCGLQAKKDNIEYFWVDTCCIDKTNSVELSEAIISMFRWYKKAEKCYVYLTDVMLDSEYKAQDEERVSIKRSWKPAFRKSRWFTRGWTLQELIAPETVLFFSKEWSLLGSKYTLGQIIHEITTIPVAVLHGQPMSLVSVDERMRWAEGRLTTKMEDQAYSLLGIFDVYMPLLYGEGSNALSRLRSELEKTRANLTSARMIDLHGLRNQLMASLRFEQMNARQSNIKNAYSRTCSWILDHSAYVCWRDATKFDRHRGFLWIKGKPGTGKSTLMKFVLTHASTSIRNADLVIAFFFNARGDVLEKSTLGLHRALLVALLQKAPDLQDVLDEYLQDDADSTHHVWQSIETLRRVFANAVCRLGQRTLRCYIDALDECDEEEVREMILFFEEIGNEALGHGIKLYICLASRHYPAINISHGEQLILEDEQGHANDLSEYVSTHLRLGQGEHLKEMRSEIEHKANGVFLWAVLVIDILNREFRTGRVVAIKKRLHEIPAKLSDLFKEILRRDDTDMDDLLLCLQWLLFARRPLRQAEFYFAMVTGPKGDPNELGVWDNDVVTAEVMKNYVLNSSKGLAELTKSKVPTVQFIHESVRDFLLQEGGLRELWPHLARNIESLSHDRLKLCCRNYMTIDVSDCVSPGKLPVKALSTSAKKLRERLGSAFPFLEYAAGNVLYHANEAANDCPQQTFLDSFPLEDWVWRTNIFKIYTSHRHSPNVSFEYLFAEHNWARLLPLVPRDSWWRRTIGERHRFPIFAAATNGHKDAFRALLQHRQYDEVAQIKDAIVCKECGGLYPVGKSPTPLIWALESKHHSLVQLVLLQMDAEASIDETVISDPSCLRNNCAALRLAAQLGQTEAIRHLLHWKTDIETMSAHGDTPLLIAAEFGHVDVVEVLLNHGANIGAINIAGQTALYLAYCGNHQDALRVLLAKSINDDVRYGNVFPPLSFAIWNDLPDLGAQLVKAGANVNIGYDRGKTPLMDAAERCYMRLVEALIDAGADVNATDDYGNTPLLIAQQAGDAELIMTLLKAGAHINARDGVGQASVTLLFAAAETHNMELARRLLEAGVDVNARDRFALTPLSIALRQGDAKLVKMLLDAGAKINARTDGDTSITLLFRAVDDDDVELAQQLLEAGVNVNTQNECGDTPLLMAAWKGHTAVAKVLLDAGADVNARNKAEYSALRQAYNGRESEMVNLLREYGA